jgi:uncharacterized membrane protein (UPF0182 family)
MDWINIVTYVAFLISIICGLVWVSTMIERFIIAIENIDIALRYISRTLDKSDRY